MNTPPAVADVAIHPPSALPGDTLTCVWTWFDLDDDADQTTVQWTVNGLPASTDVALAPTAFQAGDDVQCLAHAFDGDAFGNAESAEVHIGEAKP